MIIAEINTKQRPITVSIHIAKSRESVDAWVFDYALGCKVMGFDIEYRPNFVKGSAQNHTSLLQISVGDSILLVQLLQVGSVPISLRQLLEDDTIVKAGVGITEDVNKLQRDWGVSVRGAVDLSKLMQERHAEGTYLSLAKLSQKLLGYDMRKIKKITLSNWENKNLNDKQIRYAALDAWVGGECFAVISA